MFDAAFAQARSESQAPLERLAINRAIGDPFPPPRTEDATLAAKIAAAQAAAARGPGPSVCRNRHCLKPLTPSAGLV